MNTYTIRYLVTCWLFSMPLLLNAFESTVPNLVNASLLLLYNAENGALQYLDDVNATLPSLPSHQNAISFCSEFQHAVILSRIGDIQQANTIIDQLEELLFCQLQNSETCMSEKEYSVIESYFTLLNDQTADTLIHQRLQNMILTLISPISIINCKMPLSWHKSTANDYQYFIQSISWRHWSKKIKKFCDDLIEVVAAIGSATAAIYGAYSACDYMVHSHRLKIAELEARIKSLGAT